MSSLPGSPSDDVRCRCLVAWGQAASELAAVSLLPSLGLAATGCAAATSMSSLSAGFMRAIELSTFVGFLAVDLILLRKCYNFIQLIFWYMLIIYHLNFDWHMSHTQTYMHNRMLGQGGLQQNTAVRSNPHSALSMLGFCGSSNPLWEDLLTNHNNRFLGATQTTCKPAHLCCRAGVWVASFASKCFWRCTTQPWERPSVGVACVVISFFLNVFREVCDIVIYSAHVFSISRI